MSISKRSCGESDSMRRSQVADSIMHGQAQSVRQGEQIRNITEENDQIKKEIATVSGNQYDYVKADKLATLQGEVDALERRYQFEKMRKNDLTKRYQLARIDLLHSRKLKGGVNVEREQSEAVQRQVEILENRLDQALGKFNDALSYNKGLRDQIDIIRGERRVFQRVHKRMEDDLRGKKRTMADRIEQSNRDMDERDEYLRQAEQLQRAIAEQQQMYNNQVREMDVAMLEIKTMREDQTNLQLELEAREYEFESRLADGNLASTMNTIANNSQGSAAACSEDGDSDFGAPTNVLSVDREATTITDIMIQIREAIHDEDLESVRQEFLRLGDNNFSLYRYINELTSTKETLADEIRDLRMLLTEEGESEMQQRRLIKDLEGKLATTEMKLEGIHLSIGHLRDALSTAVSTTEDVYTQIGCTSMENNPNASESSCTDSNLLSFLGTIEERATHILCAFQSRHRQLELAATAPDTRRHREHQSTEADVHHETSEAGNDGGAAATPKGDLPPVLSADQLDYEVAPLLPIAPTTAHNAVSAQRLVKMSDLPCANLGAAEAGGSLMGDLDEDTVVSHEEIRKQMELRLMAKREREERAMRKKKELKELISTSPRRYK